MANINLATGVLDTTTTDPTAGALPAGTQTTTASGQPMTIAGQNPIIPNTTPAPKTPTPIDYTKSPNETVDQYNARIAAANADTANPASPNYNPANNYNIPKTTPPVVNNAPYGIGPDGIPYGSQYSNNPNPDAWVYGPNGQPVSPNSVNSNGLTAQEQQVQDKRNSIYDKLDGIVNGTTPLSASEESQIQGLKSQYQQLIDKQNLVNTNNSGTANLRGYQTGAAEYDPTFQQNTIGDVVSSGQTQIANLQTAEASAVAQLTESMQQNDVKMIQSSYDMYTSAHKDVFDAIAKTVADTQQALNDGNIVRVLASGITNPADILAQLQKEGLSTITASDITAAIKNLSPDAAEIYDAAKTYTANGGKDPATLKMIMASPDGGTAQQVLAKSGFGDTAMISAVNNLAVKYPDAGIVSGDTLAEANAKILKSDSYTTAQKSALLDNAYKQSEINKNNAAKNDLTPNQQTVISGAITNLAGTQQYKDFSQISTIYATIVGIDPSKITSTQEGQLAFALAQLEIPGAKSVRGAISTAGSPLNMNSGVYNLLESVQNLLDSRKPLSPDMVNQMMSAANNIYDSSRIAYSQTKNSEIVSTSNRIGTDAGQYMPDLASDTGVDEIRATNAIDTYVANNSTAVMSNGKTVTDNIKNLLSQPGVSESAVLQYIKNPSKGFPNYGDLP